MKKHNPYKILIYIYVESIHRRVFDNIFKPQYESTKKDKLLLGWYHLLVFLFPGFRPYLKLWKPILLRAYEQKRLSIINQLGFWKLRKRNVDRYSSYLF